MTRSDISQEFKDYALRLLGTERYARFAQALDEEPSVSVRLNPFKSLWAGLSTEYLNGGDGPVPWASGEGGYLSERPPFTFDPLFHAGAYYVQEAASMFLGQVLCRYVTRPVIALDLCAAPGGKSTHIRSCLPEGSLLVANEPVKARAQVLLENLTKWGHPDVVVTNCYPRDFARLPAFFDLLVTDVPCSGEGMFRKEEDAVTGWSMEAVRMCRDRQREILRDVWPSLKPGGLLVYSTCTLNTLEDEENVAWIAEELGAEILPLDVEPGWGVVGNLLPLSSVKDTVKAERLFPVAHFIPGFTRGEGFFLAVLRKNGEEGVSDWGMSSDRYKSERVKSKKKRTVQASVPALPASCRSWLLHADTFDFVSDGPVWTAIRASFSRQIGLLRESVKVWQVGVPLATVKGKDYIPLHALAMSVDLNRAAFPVVPVSYDMAVPYLRKEVLVLPPDTPKGYVLLTFQDTPIGFVKNIGGRANNLYPQEWKIRTSYLSTYSLKGDLRRKSIE